MLTARELELRTLTIGSSEVSAVCGLSPWKGPAQVLREKLLVRDFVEERPHVIGHKLERPIAELALELGDVPGCTLVPGWTVVHKDGWRSATPDFYALKTGNETYRRRKPLPKEEALVIEVKNVGVGQFDHWAWGKKVPEYVLAQVQWQFDVLGHDEAAVCAFIMGDVKTFAVERDDKWIGELTEKCHAFWHTHLRPEARKYPAERVLYEMLKQSRRAA